ncbi:hypothetical protein [Halobacillus litoralis]|uniref:hypothetical protein n=1 Tax=Halobacillus litoralis TaxID=45668 RepID=UPI0013682894|nr:hypothetical protein [Halobacillus litoralis]
MTQVSVEKTAAPLEGSCQLVEKSLFLTSFFFLTASSGDPWEFSKNRKRFSFIQIPIADGGQSFSHSGRTLSSAPVLSFFPSPASGNSAAYAVLDQQHLFVSAGITHVRMP